MKNLLLAIRIALSGIYNNKFRSFLTMLGIIIGVGSVIAIISIGNGAESLITNSIKRLGTDNLAVMPGGTNENGAPSSAYGITITTLTREDAEAIKEIPHVRYVVPYTSGNSEISYNARSLSGNFNGVTSEYPNLSRSNLQLGRFFTSEEEQTSSRIAVLGSDIRKELFPFSNPIGQKIKIANQTFQVIGVLEFKGSSMVENPDKVVFIPLQTAQNNILAQNYLGRIRLQVEDEKYIDDVKARIENLLRYRHGIENPADDDFTVGSAKQFVAAFEQITGALQIFLVFIAAVSLIVGGISVMNIMLMAVRERTREIGLRKAIGAKREQIQSQFIWESLVITTIGGIIGMIGGIALSFLVYLIVNLYLGYDWSFVISFQAIIIAISVSIAIGLTFGIYPARKAARLNPIEALRYE